VNGRRGPVAAQNDPSEWTLWARGSRSS
jgi:hypothetical protein